MLKKNQAFLEQNPPFRIKLCYSQGHQFHVFNTFSLFYQALFERLDFNQPEDRSSFHSILIENYQQEFFNKIFIQSQINQSIYRRLDPLEDNLQQLWSKFIPARKLDIGRRARTTSIKTLSTLIPNVKCLDCNGINLLIFREKSLIIAQLNQDTSFNQIMSHKKMNELSNSYIFYESNRALNQRGIITFNSDVV
jgi:hypothetical protein